MPNKSITNTLKKLLIALLVLLMSFTNLSINIKAEDDETIDDTETQEIATQESIEEVEETFEVEEETSEVVEEEMVEEVNEELIDDDFKIEDQTEEIITNENINENVILLSPSDPQPTDGEAYAVLQDNGDLVFFRSYENYENESYHYTILDIYNNKYYGTVFNKIEKTVNYDTSWMHRIYRNKIKKIYVADNQTITPANMRARFDGCYNLESFDSNGFDTSNITDLSRLFSICNSLTSLDLSNFDTSNVTDMNYMFQNCSSLTSLDLSNFGTSNVTDMSGMFYGCSSLTSLDLSSFNTSNVTDMNRMFLDCSSLTSLDLSNFDTSNVTDMSYMFDECSSLTSLNLSNFNNSQVTDMSGMFYGCSSLTSLDLSSFNTSNVTDMSGMFSDCSSLTSLDLSNFDTSNVTDVTAMFFGCSSLTSLDLSSFNTSKVTKMWGMFAGCFELKQVELGELFTKWLFDTDSCLPGDVWLNNKKSLRMTVIDLCENYPLNSVEWSGTWKRDENGRKVYAILKENGDFVFFESEHNYKDKSKGVFRDIFDEEYSGTIFVVFEKNHGIPSRQLLKSDVKKQITNIYVSQNQSVAPLSCYWWFRALTNLKSINLHGFDTSKTINMNSMFEECASLTSLDLSNFDTSNVTDMSYMFDRCSSLIDLNIYSFDTSKLDNSNRESMLESIKIINIGEKTLELSKLIDLTRDIYHSDWKNKNKNLTKSRNELRINFRNNSSEWCGTRERTIYISKVEIDKNRITINTNEYYNLIANVIPSDATNKKLTRSSSNTNVAAVDSNGKVTAKKAGTATITVKTKDGSNLSKTCEVTVIQKATSISLDKTELELEVNKSETLIATILPEDTSNKKLSWSSSDPTIATVDSSGKITAKKAGTTTITVKTTDGTNLSATCEVTVIQKATSLSLNKDNLTLEKGKSETLSATILPSDTTNKEVTWSSSNPSIASVDSNGKITANSTGTVTITVKTKDGSNLSKTCEVTVIQKATSISLDKTELTLEVNDTDTLTATVLPSDTTNKEVTWSSSNPSIASVDSNGKITANSTGTVTITVKTKDGSNLSKTCEVTVIQKATSLSLDKNNLELEEYDTYTLIATVLPKDTSNKKLSWSSSNPTIASVDSNGKITANKKGIVTITVSTTDGSNLYATCMVTVKDSKILPASIKLNKTSLELKPNDTFKLIATISPSNVTEKTITWTSSDTSVATIDSNGNIRAIKDNGGAKASTVTITAKTSNGLSATCKVTIKDPVKEFVRRLYSLCLNRQADVSGLDYYVSRLKLRKFTAAQVVNNFFSSPEFINSGHSDAEFIRRSYLACLDRQGDNDGVNYYTNILNNGTSRKKVLKGFVESPEFTNICENYGVIRGTLDVDESESGNNGINSFIARLYTNVLSRNYDQDGLKYYENIIVNASNQKQKAKDISYNFFYSPEFKSKSLTDREYLTILYNTYLNRDASEDEYYYYLFAIYNGTMTRDIIMRNFSNSPEFNNILTSFGLR